MQLTQIQKDFLNMIVERKNNFFNFSFNNKEYVLMKSNETSNLILEEVTKEKIKEVLQFDDVMVNSNNLDSLKAVKYLIEKIETLELVEIIRREYDKVNIVSVLIDFEDRKNLRRTSFIENGYSYSCNVWNREDGEVDKYNNVYQEAMNNGFN